MNKLKYAGWLVLLMGALSALQSPFVESFWIPYVAIFLSVVTSIYLTIAIIDLFYKVYCESRNVKTKVAFGLSIVCSLLFFVQYVLAFIIFFAALNSEWSVDVQNEVVDVFSVVAHYIVLVILLICAVLLLIQYRSNNRIMSVLFMAIVMCLVYFFAPFLADILIYSEGIRGEIDDNSYTSIYNRLYIFYTALIALYISVLSVVFFVFAEKDSKSESRNREIDWAAFAVLLISVVLFFCKWLKGLDGGALIHGGWQVTGGSIGLYLSIGGLLAIIFKSYRAKRNVGLAMIFWAPAVMCLLISTPVRGLGLDVGDYLSLKLYYLESADYTGVQIGDLMVIVHYFGSCLAAGILLRRAGTVPESENRPDDQRVVPATEVIDGQDNQQAVFGPADNSEDQQNIPEAESDSLDDEIAKLKAELERLKNEQNSR